MSQATAVTVRGHFWKSDGGGLPVLICPGFGEFCEKFSPAAAHLHSRGHSVLIIDWPGQGRSGIWRPAIMASISTVSRSISPRWTRLSQAAGLATGRIIILGHSMGGHLALRLASRYGERVAATIALSPMMVPRPRPVWLVRMLARSLVLAGRARHHAPSSPPRRFEDDRLYSPGNRLTRCREGYERQFTWYDDAPELWRAGASVGWVAAAYASCAATTLNPAFLRSVACPVLALTGGDETIVRKQAFAAMLPWLPDAQQHEYEGAKHELLYETEDVRADLWQRIDSFLDEIGG